jgi:hypothetical protein
MPSKYFSECFFYSYEKMIGRNGVTSLLNLAGIAVRPDQLTADQVSGFIQAAFEMGNPRQSIVALHKRIGMVFGNRYGPFLTDMNDIPALLRPMADAVIIDEDVIIEACPFCTKLSHAQTWEKIDPGLCSFVVGWLTTALQKTYTVREVQCLANGDLACIFRLEQRR